MLKKFLSIFIFLSVGLYFGISSFIGAIRLFNKKHQETVAAKKAADAKYAAALVAQKNLSSTKACYGSLIQLKHNATGNFLKSIVGKNYDDGWQQVLAAPEADWWVVRGGDGNNKAIGAPVAVGDVIRLIHHNSGLCLFASAVESKADGANICKRVLCSFRTDDNGKDWKVIECPSGELQKGAMIKLQSMRLPEWVLHSHPFNYPNGGQEIVTWNGRDNNNWFTVTDIKSIAADPVVSPIVEQLQPGTVVAIKALSWGKYLKIVDGKYLRAEGTDKTDSACQFGIMRNHNWVGFKSHAAGSNNLQIIPAWELDCHLARFENMNFLHDSHTYEHFSIIPIDSGNPSLNNVRLQNQLGEWVSPHDPSGKCCNGVCKGYVWGTYKLLPDPGSKRPDEIRFPAGPGEWERFSIEIVTPAPSHMAMTPTPRGYIHVPEKYGCFVRGSEHFTLDKEGEGSVIFEARAHKDIYVMFSNSPEGTDPWVPARMGYRFVIGGWWNSQTVIRRSDGTAFTKINNSDDLALLNITKDGNKNGVVTGGHPGKGEQWDTYWFKVSGGIVSWGKGAKVGGNEMQRWQDPAPLPVKYVLLGGWWSPVEFRNIRTSGQVAEVVLPDGFTEEGGEAFDITCGSKDGKLEAYIIGKDRLLHRYNVDSMAPDPWDVFVTKDDKGAEIKEIIDVCVSSSGEFNILTRADIVYNYDWAKKVFVELPKGAGNENVKIKSISRGNKDNLWAVGQDANLYKYKFGTGWTLIYKGNMERVAVGLDGTVVVINSVNSVYTQEKEKWVEMPGVKLTSVAVGNKDHIWGTFRKDPKTYEVWTYVKGKWESVKNKAGKLAIGFNKIGVNAAGTVFATNYNGEDIYHNGEAGVVVKVTKTADGKTVVKGEKAPTKGSKRATAKKEGKIAKKKKGAKKAVTQKVTLKGAAQKVLKQTKSVKALKTTKKVATKKVATKKTAAKKEAAKKTGAKAGA